jgi:hypothetical protein
MFILLLMSIYYAVYGSTVRETVDHLSHEVEKLHMIDYDLNFLNNIIMKKTGGTR